MIVFTLIVYRLFPIPSFCHADGHPGQRTII
jgi:hypothetical protein